MHKISKSILILSHQWKFLKNLNFTDNLCVKATNIESYACRGDSGSGVIANNQEFSHMLKKVNSILILVILGGGGLFLTLFLFKNLSYKL